MKASPNSNKIVYLNALPEGVVIGMKDGTILVGTKKERTAATVRSSKNVTF